MYAARLYDADGSEFDDLTGQFLLRFGGYFYGEEPDGLAYTPPEELGEETREIFGTVKRLQSVIEESLRQDKNLVLEQYPILIYEEGCDY